MSACDDHADGIPDARPSSARMTTTAASIAQRQLELYNARRVDPFLELFAEDVIVADGLTGAIIATSREELRPRYVERFATPVHCELLGRLVLGNVVVDREVITGLPDGGVADCLATYVCDVDANEIKRITFVWQARTVGGVVAASDGGGGAVVVEDAADDPLTRRGLPSPLLLGSASFTRKLILTEMNVPYAKLVRPIDERGIGNRGGDPGELVTMLAHAKMDHLLGEILGGNCDDELPSSSSADDEGGGRGWVILTADQVVTHGGRVLEKPDSVEEAREFVEGYADGGPVSTHGACVLAHLPSGLRTSGVDTASVYFGRTVAGSDLVDRMLREGAPILGCAGGLMIEHPLVREHVVKIDGTEDSIMGLSKDLVERLLEELKEKLDGFE
jgi:predicted house-cleaning NTP pyrophosphatase (Maf/HAM1 superfamily)